MQKPAEDEDTEGEREEDSECETEKGGTWSPSEIEDTRDSDPLTLE